MRASLQEYLGSLGYWGLLVIAAIALDVLGTFQVATGMAGGSLPGWVFISVAFSVVLVVPFVAFHRMRLQVTAFSDDRRLELKRLIIETKNATHRLVAKWELTHDPGLCESERVVYDQTLAKMTVEAEVEGGEVRKAINEFLNLVAKETMTFFQSPHPDPMTTAYLQGQQNRPDDVPDSFHFMERLQEKTDDAIKALSQ